MTGNYAVYENLYNYMNYLLNPDQGISGASTTHGGRTAGSSEVSKHVRRQKLCGYIQENGRSNGRA